MTLNNGKKIVAFRLMSLITTSLFVVYMLLAYFAKVFRNLMPSETLDTISIGVAFLYLLSVLWPVIRQYRYIYFSDDGASIILRWYSVGLISGESKSIEIPKTLFAGHEVHKKYLGMYQYITLFQHFQNRRAGFPRVPVTALNREQLRKITEVLQSYK